MADIHIQRLRMLETCPVCGAGTVQTAEGTGIAATRFVCDARFCATDTHDIFAITACTKRTATAANLLNKECKEAAL